MFGLSISSCDKPLVRSDGALSLFGTTAKCTTKIPNTQYPHICNHCHATISTGRCPSESVKGSKYCPTHASLT